MERNIKVADTTEVVKINQKDVMEDMVENITNNKEVRIRMKAQETITAQEFNQNKVDLMVRWLSLLVFHSREALLRTLASTRMERSTQIRMRITMKNMEMIRNKRGIMEREEVMVSTTRNTATHTVLELFSGLALWLPTSGD